MSGESGVEENVQGEEQDLEDKKLSGQFRWMSGAHKTDPKKETCSMADSSINESSRNSGIDTYSERNSSTRSELSELAIHTLIVETRARDLDRELYQDPDSDRFLVPSETVFDNAADDLETIAVSKRSMKLLPQKEVVRIDLQPLRQETEPLVKMGCVKMEDDTQQPDEMQKQGRLYLNKDGIVACKRREEDKVLYKYNAIRLPNSIRQNFYSGRMLRWAIRELTEYTRGF